jgi:hypothetical protein
MRAGAAVSRAHRLCFMTSQDMHRFVMTVPDRYAGNNMTRTTKSLIAGPLTVALGMALAGCGESSEPDRPETYPVTGTVTFNGAPIEGASVTFVPLAEDGKSAAGFTNATGQYTLTTFTAGDGAVAGKYRVKIAKLSQPAAPAAAAAAPPASPGVEVEAGYEPGAEDAAAPPPTSLLPAKYGDPNSSGLMVEVVGGENPPRDFKLEG